MSTDLDTRLRDSLQERTGAVTPPAADLEGLLQLGRRARRQRRGVLAGVAAAVAVVVVVTGTSLLRSGPGADGAPDLRGGLPIATGGAAGPAPVRGPQGLFVTRDEVYVDGRVRPVRLPWGTGAHVGRLGVAYPEPGGNRPSLLTRQGAVEHLAPATPAAPGAAYDGWVAADGNGPLVAWAEQTKTSSTVVAYDTSTDREVARTDLPCRKRDGFRICPNPYVVSDGLVMISGYGGLRVWDPSAGDPGPVVSGDVSQAHAEVLTTFEDLGTVDLSAFGPGWAQAKAPKGYEGILSFDGGWILDNGGRPRIVNWRDPSQTVTYRPPGTVQAAVFDTDGSVLVVTRDDGRWTGWDCAVEGPCRTVVQPRRTEIRLVAWDL